MTSDVFLAAIAVLGVGVGAFSSGAVGMGFPLVAVPAMALGYGLETAVVVSVVPTLAIDLVNLRRTSTERRDASGLALFALCAGAATLAGTVLRDSVNERILVGVLAAVTATYLATEFLPTVDLRKLARKRSMAAGAGAAAGTLQATVGVSGPFVGMFFLNRTESRHAFIFHVTVVFTVMGLVRIVTLASIRAFTFDRIVVGCVIAVFAIVVRTVGFWVGDKVDRDHFRKMVMALLACSLVPLLIQSFSHA